MKDYYPFGMQLNYGTSHPNSLITGRSHNYGYNGVEKSGELGLDWLEMDVRKYDPAISRWTSIDPVTHHSLSPFNAFDNNPIFFADPSGANSEDFINDLWNRSGEGSTTWINNNDGTFSSNDGQTAQCDDCDEKQDPAILRLKVADPRDNSTVLKRIGNGLNPFVDHLYRLETKEGVLNFRIDDDGYINIDLNNLMFIQEANPIRAIGFLRALSKIRTAANMAKFVRNANWFKNSNLRTILSQYYRANASIGNGSSASALMHELRTGELLSQSGHLNKVGLVRNQLVKLLNTGAELTGFEKQFVVRQILEANRAIRAAMGSGSNYTGTITRETLKIIRKFSILNKYD